MSGALGVYLWFAPGWNGEDLPPSLVYCEHTPRLERTDQLRGIRCAEVADEFRHIALHEVHERWAIDRCASLLKRHPPAAKAQNERPHIDLAPLPCPAWEDAEARRRCAGAASITDHHRGVAPDPLRLVPRHSSPWEASE